MIGRWTVVNAVLGLIVLMIGAQIWRSLTRSLPPVVAVEASEDDDDRHRRRKAPRSPRRRIDRDEVLALVTENDLFDPTRRAQATDPTAGPVEEELEAPPPPGVVIVGVRMLGDEGEAFVQDSSKGREQRRLRRGDDVGGYTVEEIHPTSVVLKASNGDRVTLWLKLGSGGTAVPKRRAATARPSTAAGARTTAARTQADRARRRQHSTRRDAARARRPGQADGRTPAPKTPPLPSGVRERLEKLRQGD